MIPSLPTRYKRSFVLLLSIQTLKLNEAYPSGHQHKYQRDKVDDYIWGMMAGSFHVLIVCLLYVLVLVSCSDDVIHPGNDVVMLVWASFGFTSLWFSLFLLHCSITKCIWNNSMCIVLQSFDKQFFILPLALGGFCTWWCTRKRVIHFIHCILNAHYSVIWGMA